MPQQKTAGLRVMMHTLRSGPHALDDRSITSRAGSFSRFGIEVRATRPESLTHRPPARESPTSI
jgi:hypothetical protein